MKKILPVVLLLIISSFLVFYKYDQIPRGLAHDENEIARAAFSLENKTYTPFTTVADGHATAYLYTLLFSFKLFGINQFALRLPSRIFGILNVLLFYLIIKHVYKKKLLNSCLPSVALAKEGFLILSSLLLLSSRWFLHFSRVAYEVPFLLFLELVSIYFLISFCQAKQKQNLFLILSGIFAGIAFNSYQPGRIFFLVPLLALVLKKTNWRTIIYFLTAFIIFILPMSLYLLINPGKDIRIDQQFFLKNTKISLDKKIQYLGSNLQATSLMFFRNGDINGQHNYSGKPAVNPIFSIFFVAGLIIALLNIRIFYNALFVLYFFIAMLPTIFTYPWENPNMLRTYTALPSIVYFVGQGIMVILNSFQDLIKKIPKWIRQAHHPEPVEGQVRNDNRINLNILSVIIITFLIILSSVYELRTYFKYQPLVFKQAFDVPDYLPIIRQNAQRDDLWSF